MTPCWLLRNWLELAQANSIKKANAMCLSTVSREGFPSSRMLLAGSVRDDGVTFFTDSRSPKVGDLAANPNAAILFYWPTLSRQVRLEGVIEMLPDSSAEADFESKTPDQQLAIEVCQQSTPLDHYWKLRQTFAARVGAEPEQHRLKPQHWVGYSVRARRIEYLRGGKGRLNKRLVLDERDGKWNRQYLSP